MTYFFAKINKCAPWYILGLECKLASGTMLVLDVTTLEHVHQCFLRVFFLVV
jgi:hypothetical protein